MYILTFQILSMFSAKYLVLSRVSHFLGPIPGYSGPGQIKFKFPGFHILPKVKCDVAGITQSGVRPNAPNRYFG